MTEAEALVVIVGALGDVAPEVDASLLDADAPLADQVDLDSMDFLSLVEGVSELTGLDIPEADYRRLTTLASGVAYLAGRVP